MSRKVKFSNNWKKAKAKVQKIHTGIANARKDFLHKTTTTISQNHALVCIEDLQVRNLSRSSKGNSELHGNKVAQKCGLNRSILDQGWGEFRRQLGYKVAWNGGMLLAVPPHHTSQTCPCCGHVSKDNRQTQAKFLCVDCGYENHADVVGAINILSRGMQIWRDEGQDTADASAGYASTAQIACEVNGAVMPSATGTRRSDYAKSSRSAVGIPVL
jgi:putative transposase